MTISNNDWDIYWSQQGSVTRTYGKIASIYRRWVIPRSLASTLRSSVFSGATLLHAGSGGGEVDIHLTETWNLISIDFSRRAVEEHRARYIKNGHRDLISQADLFSLPFQDETFDGVFNLGVMEHFSGEQIVSALHEMRRVTKRGGVIVLYWPPVWGLSVLVLKIAKSILQPEKRRGTVLHPPEINLVRSRRQCSKWMRNAGLELERFSFGIGDVFTHQVIVARRKK